jgi:hypothetical protein
MRLLPVLAASVAVASVALGGVHTWRELGDERARWADAGERKVARAPAEAAGLPPEVFEFFSDLTRPDDRYYVHVPRGRPVRLAVEGGIMRMFAGYFLLPAMQVPTPAEATVVLAYDADPRELGLEYVAVEELPGPVEAAVARVAR